jgi:hypothetical protein
LTPPGFPPNRPATCLYRPREPGSGVSAVPDDHQNTALICATGVSQCCIDGHARGLTIRRWPP